MDWSRHQKGQGAPCSLHFTPQPPGQNSPKPLYSPVEDVVILATPAPVLIGEAINSQKLGLTQA